VRALQPFPTSHIENVRVGRRHGQRPYGTRWLVVKDREPCVAEVGRLPYAAIHRRHVIHIGLVGHATDRHRASAAERPDTAPAYLPEQFLVILLRTGRKSRQPHQPQNQEQFRSQSQTHRIPRKTQEHNAWNPPRQRELLSGAPKSRRGEIITRGEMIDQRIGKWPSLPRRASTRKGPTSLCSWPSVHE